MLTFDDRLRRGEQWFAARLNWPAIYAGLTTPEIRRDRIRAGIKDRNLQDVKWKGEETVAQLFERLYGEAL